MIIIIISYRVTIITSVANCDDNGVNRHFNVSVQRKLLAT